MRESESNSDARSSMEPRENSFNRARNSNGNVIIDLHLLSELGLDRFFERNNHTHETDSLVHQSPWIFHFMDIIYVATMYNISHVITYCGEDARVYVIAGAYFTIMFMSRLLFDKYTSIFKANGVLHVIIFFLYGVGVYTMTLNIAVETVYDDDAGSSSSSSHGMHLSSPYSRFLQGSPPPPLADDDDFDTNYGNCENVDDYDYGFVIGYLFTRFLIFALYLCYFFVFSEVAQSSAAIESSSSHHAISAHGQNASASSSSSNSSSSKSSNVMQIGGNASAVESVVRASAATKSRGHNNSNSYSNNNSNGCSKSAVSNGNHDDTSSVHSSMSAARARRTREEERKHMMRVFFWKIVPLVFSCGLMMLVLVGTNPVLVYPLVGAMELFGEFLGEVVIDMKELMPNRELLEERLGLLFMLVLGETMLGFLLQHYNTTRPRETYSTLLYDNDDDDAK